jgi:hypothetical protein
VGKEEGVGKAVKGMKKDTKQAVEKALLALHNERTESRLSLREVERIVRNQGLVSGDDPKAIAALAKEALSEARNRIREVLEGIRESLGLSLPLPPRLAKILEKGYSLVLVTPHNLPGHVQIEAEWDEVFLRTPSPIEIWPPAALVGSKGGTWPSMRESPTPSSPEGVGSPSTLPTTRTRRGRTRW